MTNHKKRERILYEIGSTTDTWAMRPSNFDGLASNLHTLPDTIDSQGILLKDDKTKINFILEECTHSLFSCDQCKLCLGTGLVYVVKGENSLVCVIYNPLGGYIMTEEGKRQDICEKCIAKKNIAVKRFGIFDCRLVPDLYTFKPQSK